MFARIAPPLGLGISSTTQEEMEKLRALVRIVAEHREIAREIQRGKEKN